MFSRNVVFTAYLATTTLMMNGCGPMTADQTVYKPAVPRIGDIQCTFEGQSFRLSDEPVSAIVGVLPEARGGVSEYELHVLVMVKKQAAVKLRPVGVTLATSDSGDPDVTTRDFRLHPKRSEPLSSTDDEDHWWLEDFQIAPGLDPGVHKNLLLRLLIEYEDQIGEVHVLEFTIPLIPTEVTIPTSIA